MESVRVCVCGGGGGIYFHQSCACFFKSYFLLSRRSCDPAVHSTVQGVQVLQEPQNQSVWEDQVSTHKLSRFLIVIIIILNYTL